MSKNLTRKSLALGAAFALVATAVVSTPAYAADGVVLTANTGTTLAAPVTETLTLNASLVPSLPAANIAQLKYKVVTDGTFVFKAVATSGGVTTTTFSNDDGRSYVGAYSDNTADDGTDDTPGDFTDDIGYRAAGVNTTEVITPSTPNAGAVNTFALSVDATANAAVATTGDAASATTATKTAAVTAWIDSDLDGVVDAGEAQQVVTVSFIKYSEITATTTITAPIENDTTATATVVFNNVNNEQLTASEVGASFTKGDDTALDATPATVIKSSVAWDATNGYFKYTTGTVTALVKAQAVKVQPLMKNGGVVVDATAKVGTAATAVIATRAAATIAAGSVASTTANAADASLLNSSFAVKATVKDAATPTPAAVAGAAVTATVTTNAALSAVAGSVVSLTVNGTVHTSIATLPGASATVAKLALTTDANGEVSVPLTTVGYTNGQTVTVSFTTENLTATVVSTQAAASYTVNHAAFVTTTDGASVSVPVSVYDQFGGRPANNYDVRAVFDATNGNYAAQVIGGVTTASTSATSTNVALVGGNATLVITDNGTGLGVNSYDVTVEKRAAGGAYAADASMPALAVLDVHIKTAASLVAGTVTSSGVQDADTEVYAVAGTADLALVAAASYDSTTVLGTAPVATFVTPLGAGHTITGTVSTLASATVVATAIPGASVTLSGAGLQFHDGFGKYSVGSITVVATTGGAYTAEVFSNQEGKQTLTITSGAASATTTVLFADAKADTGTTLVITAPDYVLPGSTLSVSAVLTDKFGNAVTTDATAATGYLVGATTPTFSLSSTSPGFQIGTDLAVTDKNGSAKLAYFLGVNDSGTIIVTATYDADGLGTAFAAVSVTKTITMGTADVATWTSNQNDGTVKMYAKNIVGAGKVQFMLNGKEIAWINASTRADSKLRLAGAQGAAYLVRTIDLVEGQKNVLETYVDGKRSTRSAYTN